NGRGAANLIFCWFTYVVNMLACQPPLGELAKGSLWQRRWQHLANFPRTATSALKIAKRRVEPSPCTQKAFSRCPRLAASRRPGVEELDACFVVREHSLRGLT